VRELLNIVAPISSLLEDIPPLEGELLERFESITKRTDSFAAKFALEDEGEYMRYIAELLAARHPDRLMLRDPATWAGAIQYFVAVCSFDKFDSPAQARKALRQCLAYIDECPEAVDDIRAMFPDVDDDLAHLAPLAAALTGSDLEAHRKMGRALEEDAQLADELGGMGFIDVPDRIPMQHRQLYFSMTNFAEQTFDFQLDDKVVQLLHFIAEAFVKYGSASALEQPRDDIIAAFVFAFLGRFTQVDPDVEARIVEGGNERLIDIIDAIQESVQEYHRQEGLPEIFRGMESSGGAEGL
jgi:hypothetical protein